MGILGSSNTTEIGSFFRKDTQHDKKELSDQLEATFEFLKNSWDEFLIVFKEEYVRDVYVQNRRHKIDGVKQQKWDGDGGQNLSYGYINVENTFDSMPDEIYILLVSERENVIYSHECPFDTLFVTGTSELDILGRYQAEDTVRDDCLLHYRKYVKDKEITGGVCIAYLKPENTVYYKWNPYFDVKTVTNDMNFKNLLRLPLSSNKGNRG